MSKQTVTLPDGKEWIMNEQEANEVKEIARQEFVSALAWSTANQSLTGATPAEDAANMAADAVMYKLGMHDYAAFQAHIGGADVATWLRAQHGR